MRRNLCGTKRNPPYGYGAHDDYDDNPRTKLKRTGYRIAELIQRNPKYFRDNPGILDELAKKWNIAETLERERKLREEKLKKIVEGKTETFGERTPKKTISTSGNFQYIGQLGEWLFLWMPLITDAMWTQFMAQEYPQSKSAQELSAKARGDVDAKEGHYRNYRQRVLGIAGQSMAPTFEQLHKDALQNFGLYKETEQDMIEKGLDPLNLDDVIQHAREKMVEWAEEKEKAKQMAKELKEARKAKRKTAKPRAYSASVAPRQVSAGPYLQAPDEDDDVDDALAHRPEDD